MLKNSWQKGGVASKIKSQLRGGGAAPVCMCVEHSSAAACSSSWLQSSVKNEIKRARFNQSAVDEAKSCCSLSFQFQCFSPSLSLVLCLFLSLALLGCWRVSLASFSHAPREPWEPDKNAHTLYRNSRLSHKTHTKLAAFLSSSCSCCSSFRFTLVFLFEFVLFGCFSVPYRCRPQLATLCGI